MRFLASPDQVLRSTRANAHDSRIDPDLPPPRITKEKFMDSRPLLRACASRRRWASAVIGLVLVAFGVAVMPSAWAAPQPAIRGADSRAAIAGQYVVMLKHTASTSPRAA